ncbi:MAG: hypothetical protein HY318_07345 [Armatimonadetes bacterium]|nr:hypothetical protein [Armatimonadota bacterium]
MNTVKQAALETISRLPDEVSWEEVVRELYVREKVEQGLTDAEEGRVISHERINFPNEVRTYVGKVEKKP